MFFLMLYFFLICCQEGHFECEIFLLELSFVDVAHCRQYVNDLFLTRQFSFIVVVHGSILDRVSFLFRLV